MLLTGVQLIAVIYQLNGTQVPEWQNLRTGQQSPNPLTLREAIRQCLGFVSPDDKEKADGVKKMADYELAREVMAVKLDEIIELTPEEQTRIKDQSAAYFTPEVQGVIWGIIDPTTLIRKSRIRKIEPAPSAAVAPAELNDTPVMSAEGGDVSPASEGDTQQG